jgi:phasin family protein
MPGAAIFDPKPAAPLSKLHTLQEIFTMTTPNLDFADAFKSAFTDAQEKAKVAYDKSTAALGEASEFAKGNVEALVQSNKIVASGLQELTSELVAEGREAFETLSAEVKSLAAAKSPAEFFSLQSELLRNQLQMLIANGTKHSEAFVKLATDAAAPISARVSLAAEKVQAAA